MRELQSLLGCTLGSPEWDSYIGSKQMEINTYPDIHFYNSRAEALSFQFLPDNQTSDGTLVTIDVYNGQRKWGQYPNFPIVISWLSGDDAKTFHVTDSTRAIDLVEQFGEPVRKGGGGGSGLSGKAFGPALWMEWCLDTPLPSTPKIYLLVEMGGEAARAPDRWESGRGSHAVWATLSLSTQPPKT